MDNQSFEERYMDVLQNLEFGIVQVARRSPWKKAVVTVAEGQRLDVFEGV